MQKDLNQLHFIITEADTGENRKAVQQLFLTIFRQLIESLGELLASTGRNKPDSTEEVLAYSFADRRFNRQTYAEVKKLAQLAGNNDPDAIYNELQNDGARLLQMFADLLKHFGEDVEDEN